MYKSFFYWNKFLKDLGTTTYLEKTYQKANLKNITMKIRLDIKFSLTKFILKFLY